MTNEELAAIEMRVMRAFEGTEGERWVATHDYGRAWTVVGLDRVEHAGGMHCEDAEFIAHARDDVPALIAEVRRLKALEEDAKRLDWMERHPDAIPVLHDRDGWLVNPHGRTDTTRPRFATFREAIDNRRNGEAA